MKKVMASEERKQLKLQKKERQSTFMKYKRDTQQHLNLLKHKIDQEI